MYIKRNLEAAFLEANEFFPVLLVNGPRQVGKTTFLRMLAKPDRKFVSLDSPELRALAQDDPKMFLSNYSPPVIIDEIQYAPNLLNYIKIMVDDARFKTPEKARGMFWLTGSQHFVLMKGITESLAGRIGIFDMPGLSNAEMDGRSSVPFLPDTISAGKCELNSGDFFHRIWKGSYPGLYCSGDKSWERFYSGYLQSYLERDVRDLTQVGDLNTFYAFIKSVAARSGQMLNYASLARDVDMSSPTAKKYLSILEASGLVKLLYPYMKNRSKQMICTPKLYMVDCGLMAFLTGWNTPTVLMDGAMAGHFFETWCFIEILKSYQNAGKMPHFYYYRDKDDREIDLIIEENGTLYPIEFKKSATFKASDVRSFSALSKFQMLTGMGTLISMYPENIKFQEQCQTFPAP
jgi:predicted AAA+ superfamily ATPase